jgi:hypothetical protein
MKRTAVLAALLIATSAALANDVDPMGFEKEHFQFSKSRAEVVADLRAAQAAGQMPVGELGVKPTVIKSEKTRAEVAADTRDAARRGLLSGYGELGPKLDTFNKGASAARS